MRWFLAVFCGVLFVGCFAKLAPEPGGDGGSVVQIGPDGGVDASLLDANLPEDASLPLDVTLPDGNAELPDGQPLAPIPVCSGHSSECVLTGHTYTGVSLVACEGVYFVGNMTLLLERSNATGQFDIVQSLVSDTPGLGETFDDSTAPPDEVTYRVCVQDVAGVRCGASFSTDGPPDCSCQAYTCTSTEACNATIYDGCGGSITCGACAGGVACNPDNHSCCPIGFQPRLGGGCECAPGAPCAGWNPGTCECDAVGP